MALILRWRWWMILMEKRQRSGGSCCWWAGEMRDETNDLNCRWGWLGLKWGERQHGFNVQSEAALGAASYGMSPELGVS
ncbi:hypothetical protein KY284_027298 [Solanum tuberosum]|nr:hypothetical protein KY284_027298 [Solanum tuberosum]